MQIGSFNVVASKGSLKETQQNSCQFQGESNTLGI
jgi:hypothetical protein